MDFELVEKVATNKVVRESTFSDQLKAEVAEAWRIAILRRHAPTALALTRQKVGVIDRTRFASAKGLRRGGYILAKEEVGTGAVATRWVLSKVQRPMSKVKAQMTL